MVDHTQKCSDKYKVFIILNLTHLESLIIHATDLSTFEEKIAKENNNIRTIT